MENDGGSSDGTKDDDVDRDSADDTALVPSTVDGDEAPDWPVQSISNDSGNRNGSNSTAYSQIMVIKININDTAHGAFDVFVRQSVSVELLKTIIANKLKIPKESFCALFAEHELLTGTLVENKLTNESTVKLMPKMISSSIKVSSESNAFQSIETLKDENIEEFLKGKIALFINLRLDNDTILFKFKLKTLLHNICMSCHNCEGTQLDTIQMSFNELEHHINLRLRSLNRYDGNLGILYQRRIMRLIREYFSTLRGFDVPSAHRSESDEAFAAETNALDFMEASKVLTQTLRQLSERVFVNKVLFSSASSLVNPVFGKFNSFSEISCKMDLTACLNCGILKQGTATIIYFLNDAIQMIGEAVDVTNYVSENADDNTLLPQNVRILKNVRQLNLIPHEKIESPQEICICNNASDIREGGELCKVCINARENSRTKTKLENIRLAMKQNKERRDGRKRKKSPYNVAKPQKKTTESNVDSILILNGEVAVAK